MHAPLPSTRGPEDAGGTAGSVAQDSTVPFVTPEHDPSAAAITDPFPETRIGQLLQQAGMLTADNAERVARTQHELGLRFGEAALRLGLVNQDDIDAAIARQFAYPFIARGDSVLSPKLVAAFDPAGVHGDTLRAIRSQLLLRWFGTGQHALVISGLGIGDASSVLAANLALVFAQLGQRTLLVDANMRHGVQDVLFGLHVQGASRPAATPFPGLHSATQSGSKSLRSKATASLPGMQSDLSVPVRSRSEPIWRGRSHLDVSRTNLSPRGAALRGDAWPGPSQPGLSDVLAGRAGLDAILSIPGFDTLSLLSSGTVPPNPQELLERPSFARLHAQLGEEFDVVLYDIAPSSHAAEALAIAAYAGAALLVARKNHTPVAVIKELARQMTAAQVTVIGSVLVEE
jgi:Mrp family chromosome partitioning ATPase